MTKNGAYVAPKVEEGFQTKVKNMNAEAESKCAYSWCKCAVKVEGEYCSDYCSDADDEHETEIQCDCKHTPCALN